MSQQWSGGPRGRSISRRELLMTVPAVAAAARLQGQSAKPKLVVRDLNHLTLSVSDPRRSLEFYQGLLGMPVQARQGATVLLRIGQGPQFLALGAAGKAPPGINHYCLTVDNFQVDRVLSVLSAHGVARADGGSGVTAGPMRAWVRMRGPDAGGARDGTPELYFGDPDGVVVQLQDPRYCGGSGAAGEVCAAVEPPPKAGQLRVEALNHFTMFVADAKRSNAFYQGLFGLPVRSYQGPASPTLAIGAVGFLMFAGVPGASRAASINHVCLTVAGFDVDRITRKLERFGITPRGATAPGPLQWYVSVRQENRGGAREGTPELYFTDPDGIPIQLQDVSYCGGGGVLGHLCS